MDSKSLTLLSEIARWKEETKTVELIVKNIQEIISTREDEKILSPQKLSEDLIGKIIKCFQLFGSQNLSETVGGVKRYTENVIPWGILIDLPVALNDPHIVETYNSKLIIIIDTEFNLILSYCQELLIAIRTAIENGELHFDYNKAIDLIDERIKKIQEISDVFQASSNEDIDQVDAHLEHLQIYYEERKKDNLKKYKIENKSYLTISSRSKLNEFEERKGFYSENSTLEGKKGILKAIIADFMKEAEIQKGIYQTLLNMSQNFFGLATIKLNLSKLNLENASFFRQTAYNKRAMIFLQNNLKAAKKLSINLMQHLYAILEILSIIGEIEKDCTFMEKKAKWTKARTIICHIGDTKKATEKFKTLIKNKNDWFFWLQRLMEKKLSSLLEYFRNHFDENSFWKKGSILLDFDESLDLLINKLEHPQELHVNKSMMKQLQASLQDKKSFISMLMKLLSQLILSKLTDKDVISIFYISFTIKMIGEIFKFIEELELKDNQNKDVVNFYTAKYNFFEFWRKTRGELAHSRELTSLGWLKHQLDSDFIKDALKELKRLMFLLQLVHSKPELEPIASSSCSYRYN